MTTTSESGLRIVAHANPAATRCQAKLLERNGLTPIILDNPGALPGQYLVEDDCQVRLAVPPHQARQAAEILAGTSAPETRTMLFLGFIIVSSISLVIALLGIILLLMLHLGAAAINLLFLLPICLALFLVISAMVYRRRHRETAEALGPNV